MRTIIVICISLFISLSSFSQEKSVKTITISVKGNCEECKARIENAADIKGVKICSWNEDTQIASITYRSDKVTPEQIEKAIAASGHDAGTLKGDDKSYAKLPSCCKYRDKKCEEKK